MNALERQLAFEAPFRVDRKRLSKQGSRLRLYIELILVDCLAITAGFAFASSLRSGHWLAPGGVNLALMVIPLFVGVAINSNAYSAHVLSKPLDGIHRASSALVFAVFSVLLVNFFTHTSDMISRLAFATSIVVGGTLLVVGRLLFHRYARRVTGGNPMNELIIVDGLDCEFPTGASVLDTRITDLRPDPADPAMRHRLGTCVKGFDRVIVACPMERRATWALLLKGANIDGEILVPQFNEVGALGLGSFHGQDTILVSRGPLDVRNRAKKRILDLVITVPALIFVAPLLLVVAIAVKLDSPGSIFFLQDRLGRGNRLFKMIKFRSMRSAACDHEGSQSTQRDDDRVTRVGRFIRKTSIDELPQLINVLKGDMSLVGPRPHALGSRAGQKLFWEVDQEYWHRHALKPGITGLAQIRGYRGATPDSVDLSNRLRADLEYMREWEVWRDISILLGTFKVLVHRNAY